MRGWRHTVGSLIDICWFKQTYQGAQFTGIRVKRRGVLFHRIRDLKQYLFNSIPPTSHRGTRILGWRGPAQTRLGQASLPRRAGTSSQARIPVAHNGFPAPSACRTRVLLPMEVRCYMSCVNTVLAVICNKHGQT